MTEIELAIDELIIEGTTDFEARRIGQVVEIELSRLLQTGGLPHQAVHAESILAPEVDWSPRATAEQIGLNIAQAVYQALA